MLLKNLLVRGGVLLCLASLSGEAPVHAVTLQTDKVAHVFSASEPVTIQVGDAADGQSLTFTLTNAHGDTVGQHTASVSNGTATLGTLEPGWYHATANGASLDFSVARDRPAATAFADDSPFALASQPWTPTEWKPFTDLGVKWCIVTIPWAYGEPQKNVFWFARGAKDYHYDDIIQTEIAHKIRTVIHTNTSPDWAHMGPIGSYPGKDRNVQFPSDDDHWGDYEHFMEVMANRFKPLGIHYYLLWSEAEGSMFQGAATPRFPKVEAYQKMMIHAHAGLKRADSQAHLMGPGDYPVTLLTVSENGYTGDKAPYDGKVLPGVGKDLIDVVTGDFYWTDWQSSPKRVWAPEEHNPGRGKVTLAQSVVSTLHTADGRPFWVTEFGYGTARSGDTPEQMFVSEDEQASLMVRYYLTSLAAGTKRVFWYYWKDDAGTSYGLLRKDGTAKPAYVAYRTMTERLEGLTFDRYDMAGPGVWAARFSNGSRTVIAVWKTTSGDKNQSVSVPWTQVRQTDRDGAISNLTARNGKVAVKLHEGEPIYLDE